MDTSSRSHRKTQRIGGQFGDNNLIQGGHFTNVVEKHAASKDGFKRLRRHVATAAFHNSAQRLDPPKCHPNTRQAVLDEIFNWILRSERREAWIMWLNGAAGAGKSAIAQSLAELCIEHDILVIVESNPLIFKQSFDTQLEELIINLLRGLSRSAPSKMLLIVDGVDECSGHSNQSYLIATFAKFLAMKDLPIIVLFGSRAESQLVMAFNSPEVSNMLHRLPLDNRYLPDADIRLFLNDNFTKINKIHPFRYLLDRNWPTPALVQEIVDKSSGQFIYASVVMNFVSSPRADPARQLAIVRGLRPSGLSTPFAQLDALYRHIFSEVQDIHLTVTFLAFILLCNEADTSSIASFFRVSMGDVHVAFADLASVISWKQGYIRFLHASLPDFLVDQSRSQQYYVRSANLYTELSITWHRCIYSTSLMGWNAEAILTFLENANSTPKLRESILTFNSSPLTDYTENFYPRYLTAIQRLDFGDGGEVYRNRLLCISSYVRREWPGMLHDIQAKHDVPRIKNLPWWRRVKAFLRRSA